MSGIGIGLSVGVGAMIGAMLVAPGAPLVEYVATLGFYGIISGLLFELYKFAFTWKAPFGR